MYSDEFAKTGWVVVPWGLGISIWLKNWVCSHNLRRFMHSWTHKWIKNSYLIFQWNFFLCLPPRRGHHREIGNHLIIAKLKTNKKLDPLQNFYLFCIFCLSGSTFSGNEHWLVLTVSKVVLIYQKDRNYFFARKDQPVFEHVPVGSLCDCPKVRRGLLSSFSLNKYSGINEV